MEVEYVLVIIVAVLVALDFISGLIKAFATDTYSSTRMRQGLMHKAVYLILIALAFVLQYAASFIDLGIIDAGILVDGVCAWIILTEVGSILENLVAINPSLQDNKLLSLFKDSVDKPDIEEEIDVIIEDEEVNNGD